MVTADIVSTYLIEASPQRGIPEDVLLDVIDVYSDGLVIDSITVPHSDDPDHLQRSMQAAGYEMTEEA